MNGKCNPITGACTCNVGYYGRKCSSQCYCASHQECHPKSGQCVCPKGYSGPLCKDRCPNGKFGHNCEKTCTCDDGPCDPVNGHCNCAAGFSGENCKKAIENYDSNDIDILKGILNK